MSRPIHVLIDLSALEHNLSVVRRYAPHSRIMAVIKANAYGHGLLHAARALKRADGFALLELDAAICLRKSGYGQPILLLEGFFSTTELALCIQYSLSVVIHHKEQLMMMSALDRLNKLDVFIKINTGMNRLGFAPEEFPFVLQLLESNPAVNQISLMTHFANADNFAENSSVSRQIECFNTLTKGMKHLRSLANSAAIMQYPATHADWVRPGIMLYGASPFPDRTAIDLGLHPVMTVSSKLIAIQNLKAGSRVGYGGQFKATHAMRIGIVAGGYADGYPRHALTGTPVLVNGQRTHTLGFASMDMLAVDLSHIESAVLGSPVILWGKGLPVDEVASTAGTISYELLCAMAPRVEAIIQNT